MAKAPQSFYSTSVIETICLPLSCRAHGYGYTLCRKLLTTPQFCKWFLLCILLFWHFPKRLLSKTDSWHSLSSSLCVKWVNIFLWGQEIILVSSKMNRWFYDLVIVLPKEELIVHLSRKADAKKNIVYLNQTHAHVKVQFILGLKLFHF